MRVNITKLVINTAVMMMVIGASLFIPAGTIAWPEGWTYLLLMLTFTIALSAWLLRFNPELLNERMSGIGRANQKHWDKVFLAFLAVSFLGWLALMGFDSVRFQWSRMGSGLQDFGSLLLVTSFYLFYLVFRENTFLSPAVRIQRERGHTVVSTGPYAVVRHPMYAAFILFSLGTAFLLGSWYGVLGALVLIAMIAWRAVQEERVLTRELKGYDDYIQRVRYRFIPHVW